jgi:hypothetical protein
MTQISLFDVNDELAKTYRNASKKEQQKIKQIVEDAIVRLMQPPNLHQNGDYFRKENEGLLNLSRQLP